MGMCMLDTYYSHTHGSAAGVFNVIGWTTRRIPQESLLDGLEGFALRDLAKEITVLVLTDVDVCGTGRRANSVLGFVICVN
jgi:hypothetical protein